MYINCLHLWSNGGQTHNTTNICPCFSLILKSFENLDNNLTDWTKENVRKCIVKVWKSEVRRRKQILEQSQLNGTKRSTKWVLKFICRGNKQLLISLKRGLNFRMADDMWVKRCPFTRPLSISAGLLWSHVPTSKTTYSSCHSSYLSALPTIQVHPELDGRTLDIVHCFYNIARHFLRWKVPFSALIKLQILHVHVHALFSVAPLFATRARFVFTGSAFATLQIKQHLESFNL